MTTSESRQEIAVSTLEEIVIPTPEELVAQLNSKSQSCQRQPGEPLESFRWFKIFVTLPPPRLHKIVAEIAGLRPTTRRIAKAANDWRWQERIAEADRPGNGFPALQSEWRTQLLGEIAYIARFTGLEDTSRALAAAAIGKLDRAAARRRLGTLDQHQRGLLNLSQPRRKESAVPEISERRLHGMVLDRRHEMRGLLFNIVEEPILRRIYGESECEDDPADDAPNRQTEAEPPETDLWRQQPGEPDQHFYCFRIFLSLDFLQSTRQVAEMVGFIREAALARIASKWNWEERAAAFDAYLIGEPLARVELQLDLLQDKAFEAHLRGLLDATAAIETAAIGSLGQAEARRRLPLLMRRQRSLLQSFWRQHEAIKAGSAEKSDLLLAALVDKKAIQMAYEEKPDDTLRRIYGRPEDYEDDAE